MNSATGNKPKPQRAVSPPPRLEIPPTRVSLTQRRVACGFKLYVTVSFMDDGHSTPVEVAATPVEVFCKIAKQGSVMSGLMDGVCGPLSIGLQHGIPWEVLSKPLRHHSFESNGDPKHSSVLDALVQCVDSIVDMRKEMIGDDDPRTDGNDEGDDPASPVPSSPNNPPAPLASAARTVTPGEDRARYANT